MTPAAFVNAYRPAALKARAGTGVRARVILAQWALETAYGTSALAVKCHNMAGIRYYGRAGTTSSHGFACYKTLDAFVADYIHTLNLSYYSHVKVGKTTAAQIAALGASPWSASHYGNPPGTHLLAVYHVMFPKG